MPTASIVAAASQTGTSVPNEKAADAADTVRLAATQPPHHQPRRAPADRASGGRLQRAISRRLSSGTTRLAIGMNQPAVANPGPISGRSQPRKARFRIAARCQRMKVAAETASAAR